MRRSSTSTSGWRVSIIAIASSPSAASRNSPPSRASVSITSRRRATSSSTTSTEERSAESWRGHGFAQLLAREGFRDERRRAERRGGAAPLLGGADDHRHSRRRGIRLELRQHLPAVELPGQEDVEADRRRAAAPSRARGRLRPWPPARLRGRRARGSRASTVASVGSSSITSTRARLSAALARQALGSSNQNVLPAPSSLVEADLPAVGGHDLLAERQAEPRAADLARVRGVDAEEAREDVRLLAGGDAEAGVGHLDAREALAGRRRDRHGAAGGRVLDGVGEQVGDHLPDAVAVADHRQRFRPAPRRRARGSRTAPRRARPGARAARPARTTRAPA